MTGTQLYSGILPILATPFHDDERLDLDSLRALVRFARAANVQGIVALGQLGEPHRLSDEEKIRVLETVLETAGGAEGLEVIAGVNQPGAAAAVRWAEEAEKRGAAGLLVSPAKDATGSEGAVLEFFRRLAERGTIPICVQDYPEGSGVQLPTEFLARLVGEIPRAVSIKVEAPPVPAKVAALRALLPARQVTLLTGLGGLYSYFELQRGADGIMTGFAFPEVLLALREAFGTNDATCQERAFELYRRYLPLIVFEQQPGVGARKEALRLRGLLASSRVRHPGGGLDPGAARQLAELVSRTFGARDLSQPLQIA